MLIVGPTGAGKSVLLAMLALQFRRYHGAQVVLFDKGCSARAAVLAMGGDERSSSALEGDAGVPAAAADRRARSERAWARMGAGAARQREGRRHAGGQGRHLVGAAEPGLGAGAERTLTGLAVLLQSNALQPACSPTRWKGPTAGCSTPPRTRWRSPMS